MLDMIALGIIVPVLPKLVLEFKSGNMASAAAITGVFGFFWALMQFFFRPDSRCTLGPLWSSSCAFTLEPWART